MRLSAIVTKSLLTENRPNWNFVPVVGTSGAVQENMAMLTAEDRQAIAAYLKSVPTPEKVSVID